MSLCALERKEFIVKKIHLEGKIRSDELVDELQVSFETIRRTLEELEKENKLKRVYGGAVKLTLDRMEPVYRQREHLYVTEKEKIGRAGAGLVQDNDVILIDDGTTPLQMIHYLTNTKGLTVITNSFPAVHCLQDYKNRGMFDGDIVVIGGMVNSHQDRVSGVLAERMLEGFHANKAFISIDGIQLKKGITSYDADRGSLVRKFIEHAEQTIVMTDHSKIGAVKMYKIADVREVDIIISDVEVPEAWADTLDRCDTTWMHAK
jgi:DeoR/GlpR family transcriptional regulator of sugar metabolism